MGSSSPAPPEAGARRAVRESRPVRARQRGLSSPPADGRQPKVTGRIATLTLMMVLAIALLTAVPAVRPVVRTIDHVDPVWIVAAIALELASCVSFVVLFPVFFDRLSRRDARALAWTEMASGALPARWGRRRPSDRGGG
jgi:hypothetical protein